LNNPNKIEEWGPSLISLPEIIKDLIFFKVWVLYENIDGIHPDFGRMSYINSNEISEYYWINQDQRFDLILQLIDTFQEADKHILSGK